MSALDPLIEALRIAAPELDDWTCLASVTGTSPLRLMFDGEDTASTRDYTRLSSYTPTLNDRVLCARVGSTWTVLGKVV
jgi:hypothetical protein